MSRKYYIHYCWNGDEKQVAWTDTYESKREWRWDIDGLIFDILDEDERNCWVDYGDNDDWSGDESYE